MLQAKSLGGRGQAELDTVGAVEFRGSSRQLVQPSRRIERRDEGVAPDSTVTSSRLLRLFGPTRLWVLSVTNVPRSATEQTG